MRLLTGSQIAKLKDRNGSTRDGDALELTAGKLTSKLSGQTARQSTFPAGSARPIPVAHHPAHSCRSIGIDAAITRSPPRGMNFFGTSLLGSGKRWLKILAKRRYIDLPGLCGVVDVNRDTGVHVLSSRTAIPT